MDEKSTGLVLRTRPLTETSLIVHWLTPDLGRIATVAKGARRPKSPLRGKLDLFYSAEFTFARSRRSDLHTLREVALRDTRPALRADYDRLQHAAYAARLVELASETETPTPELHDLLRDFLDHLNRCPTTPALSLAFQARLLHVSGSLPEPGLAPLDPGNRQVLRQAVSGSWDLLHRLSLSSHQFSALSHFLDAEFSNALALRPPPRPSPPLRQNDPPGKQASPNLQA